MSGSISKIPILIITLVIGFIMVTTAVLPLAADYSEAKTYKNDGLWRMKYIEDGDEWAFNKTGPVITYNDIPQTGVISDGGTNWILGDTWCVRTNGNARGSSISGSGISTITALAGEVTITLDGVTGTSTQDLPGYGIDNSGDYVLKSYDKAAYLKGDSVIYGTGQTTTDEIQYLVHVEGSINDGVTFTAFGQRNSTAISNVVFTDVTINCTPINGYKDLYSFESVSANISFDVVGDTTESHTGTVTYSSVVVPYSVSSDPDNPDTFKNMVRIVPLIALVALVAAAAGMIYFKGKE